MKTEGCCRAPAENQELSLEGSLVGVGSESDGVCSCRRAPTSSSSRLLLHEQMQFELTGEQHDDFRDRTGLLVQQSLRSLLVASQNLRAAVREDRCVLFQVFLI